MLRRWWQHLLQLQNPRFKFRWQTQVGIRAGSSAHGPHGCANNHYFHQPELEAVLRAGLARYPQVQVHTRHEVLAIEDGAEHARLQVRDLASGKTHSVQARYVVGCDGARSQARKWIGAQLSGTDVVSRVQSTYFRAPDLIHFSKRAISAVGIASAFCGIRSSASFVTSS